MIRLLLVIILFLKVILIYAEKLDNKNKNLCEEAINKNTIYNVSGPYGSRIESELNPSAAYVLLKEMKKFFVLKNEFVEKTTEWRFEFAEMIGGKTIVFVFHEKIFKAFCGGSNSFFVEKK